MMFFKPILVEDVLTISKKEIEDFAAGRYDDFFTTPVKKFKMRELDVEYLTKLYWSEHGDNDALSVILQFPRSDNTALEFDANVNFNVKSANLSVNDNEEHGFAHPRKPGFWQWSADICKISDVLDPEKKFIDDGKLTVNVNAMIFPRPGIQFCCWSPLGVALCKRDDRDFTIVIGKDGESKSEIKIHKNVLASRSPVFDRMLETNMKEKAESKLNIVDFDVKVICAALGFFYDYYDFNNEEDLDTQTFINLLRFADKYDVEDLKTKLQYFLLTHIYPNTICQIANASVIFNSHMLKDACIKILNLYIKHGIQFNNAETLDEDIKKELGKIDSAFNIISSVENFDMDADF